MSKSPSPFAGPEQTTLDAHEDDCACDGLPNGLPCWDCYREGRKDLPA